MTIIIGYRVGGDVWFGADSRSSNDWVVSEIAQPKVFAREDLLIGSCGTWRLGQLLRFSDGCPNPNQVADDAFAFMVKQFVPWFRETIREAGYLEKEKERERSGDGLAIIVGFRDQRGVGRLFGLCSDFGVTEDREPYAVTGSGYQIALGAMHLGNRLREVERMEPITVVRHALIATCAHSAACGGPATIISTQEVGR